MPGRRPWIVAAFASAGVVFACFLVGLPLTEADSSVGRLVDNWLYNALIATSFALAAARAIFVREDRLAWSVLALALACTSFAEIYFLVGAPEEYPSLADAAWLAFYPLCYASSCSSAAGRPRSPARSGSTA